MIDVLSFIPLYVRSLLYTAKKVVLTQFGYITFLLSACIVKHSGVPLPALHSKQIKNLIWLSRTLANIMGEYFANENVESCGKGHETEATKMN